MEFFNACFTFFIYSCLCHDNKIATIYDKKLLKNSPVIIVINYPFGLYCKFDLLVKNDLTNFVLGQTCLGLRRSVKPKKTRRSTAQVQNLTNVLTVYIFLRFYFH